MATLRRESDGEGYFGSRVESIDPETQEIKAAAGPEVGKMFLVGTVTAGMFSTRDWWRTNVVTEILEETEDKVRFKTASGSTYTFER
jgi:hypothetical protein